MFRVRQCGVRGVRLWKHPAASSRSPGQWLLLFNGQGRPLNPDGYSCALHASMGGNKTPMIDQDHCYFGQDSWVEWYHGHLTAGGAPLATAPKRLRRLTIDEAIRIQTFPPDYQFIGSQSSIYRQIGNAVPCDLAQVVATVVANCLMQGEKRRLRPLGHPDAKQLTLTV
jgi:DNA (cytosine-5)-methyltransferase 1